MQTKIDITKAFADQFCSLELAKKAKTAGFTCANTFYSYDEAGEIGDGAWMERPEVIEQLRKMTGKADWKPPVMYPAINLAMAIGMLEYTDLEHGKVECYEYNGKYFFKYKGEVFQGEKLANVLVEVWLKHRKGDNPIGRTAALAISTKEDFEKGNFDNSTPPS
jgi:hypothetical protein